jgi:glycosyltransferase involved in cell wall biosynthesis
VIGAELARSNGAKLIYDAHEVEFHRNRKNSWLRLAFDWAIEKRVIESAHEVRVVNTPIAKLYRIAFPKLTTRLRVVTNDHFQIYPIQSLITSLSESTIIVYVGGGVKGRMLEKLAHAAAHLNMPVHAFFINAVPSFAIQAGWSIGGKDYEKELVELISSNRCLMWCCLEHASLSYRLSLPNKFFQALAVGMPIIVSSGGYLEEVVREHRIGAIFDGTNFDHIVMRAKSDGYLTWVNQVKILRDEIRGGRIQL